MTEHSVLDKQAVKQVGALAGLEFSIENLDWRIGYSAFAKQNEAFEAIAQQGKGAAVVYSSGHALYVRFDKPMNEAAVHLRFPEASSVTSILSYSFDHLAQQQPAKLWTASSEAATEVEPDPAPIQAVESAEYWCVTYFDWRQQAAAYERMAAAGTAAVAVCSVDHALYIRFRNALNAAAIADLFPYAHKSWVIDQAIFDSVVQAKPAKAWQAAADPTPTHEAAVESTADPPIAKTMPHVIMEGLRRRAEEEKAAAVDPDPDPAPTAEVESAVEAIAQQQPAKLWTATQLEPEFEAEVEPAADPTPTAVESEGQQVGYTQHAASAQYPALFEEEFKMLKADIEKYGQHNPIFLDNDGKQVVDGWHRYRACQELGIAPLLKRLDSSVDVWAFARSQNEHRRHFTTWDKASAAEEEAQGSHGGDRRVGKQEPKLTLAQSAERRGVSTGMAKMARVVKRKGIPELPDLARSEVLSVEEAYKVAKEGDHERQRRILAKAMTIDKPGKVSRAITRLNLADKAKVDNDPANFPDGVYKCIYADPPWKYEGDRMPPGMEGRGVAEIYPVMDTAAIKQLQVGVVDSDGQERLKPVKELCGEKGILYLWATAPKLPDALEVMKAWGFEYKQHMVWHHGHYGTGYWVRGEHELLLIGTRGSVGTPMEDARPRSVLTKEDAPYIAHSVKPPIVYELIDKQFPAAPKIELFARDIAAGDKRAGWQYWGSEVDPDQG